MTSNAQYSLHPTHYIWHLIYSVWSHIHYECYITQWLYLWHQTLYVYDIFIYMASRTVLWPHNHCVSSQPLWLTLYSVYFRHYTKCTNFMKRSECMSSQHVFVWQHTHHISHQIHSLWNHTTLFMTSSPLCLILHPIYLTYVHCICVITPTLSMISQTPYVWSHIQYTCDILSSIWYHILYVWQHKLCVIDTTLGICVTSFALHMLSHPLYHTKPQYLWCHNYFRHDFTPTISDITPMYLCHHNLSTDIITTFVCHHTHYMDDNICTLHNIISTPYVITLLCLCHHSLYIWNHIQHVGPHIHYTCDIRATNLCHHSQSIENITHALYDIRLG